MYGRRMSRRGSYKFAKRGSKIHVKNFGSANYVMRGGERIC